MSYKICRSCGRFMACGCASPDPVQVSDEAAAHAVSRAVDRRQAAAASRASKTTKTPAKPKPAAGPAEPDRAQRDGEDPFDWAVATGRIRAASVQAYRRRKVSAQVLAAMPAGIVQLVDGVSATRAPRERPLDVAATVMPPTGRGAWDRNPLVNAARSRDPQAVAAAQTKDPAPTLFSGGDLPPFTASGIDPQVLLSVPWQARHAIASEGSQATAYAMLQEYTGQDAEAAAAVDFGGADANAAYERRVTEWMVGGMSEDELEAALFGETSDPGSQ